MSTLNEIQALLQIPWQTRLAHDRVVRDALVACGNPVPPELDPPGGLIPVQGKIFKGSVFWAHMEQHRHSSANVLECCCRNKPIPNL
jgi:hypothetical protein